MIFEHKNFCLEFNLCFFVEFLNSRDNTEREIHDVIWAGDEGMDTPLLTFISITLYEGLGESGGDEGNERSVYFRESARIHAGVIDKSILYGDWWRNI